MQENNQPRQKQPSLIKAYSLLILLASFIFVSDQIVKQIVVNNLAFGESWEPIPGLGRIFQFTYITNTGAAFGIFSSGGQTFVIFAVAVALGIFYYYPTVDSWLVRICLGLIMGGALGNFWDRIFNNGAVIDYIDIGFWPIFNIADMSVVFGVSILAVWLWREEEKHRETQEG